VSTPSERVAKEFDAWKGHLLAPAPRKADRAATFEAMRQRLIDAARDPIERYAEELRRDRREALRRDGSPS